ncbi:MAG: aminopeptidase [Bacteroidota bacterium]
MDKTEGQLLQERLMYNPKNAWERTGTEEKETAFSFAEGYKDFLNKAKTEREFVAEAEIQAKAAGFLPLEEMIQSHQQLRPGMKVYAINHQKSIILAIIGKKNLTEGANVIGAHIDAPRLDLKQNPLYEDTGLALLKTHYYGGIKKYQWVTIPLALHGVIIKQNGETVNIAIGDETDDFTFTITDLLPHLAHDQMEKKMSEGITGEGLNLLFGSIPYQDEKVEDKVKLNLVRLLNEKYGLIEEDFVSAELEIVPAFKAKDIGLDRGLVGAYGQDDRVCSYGAFRALLDLNEVGRTAVCLLTDKEEIGSVGNTGAQSSFFENFLATICAYSSTDNYHDLILRNCLSHSKMLSADVNPGVDPNFEGVQDKRNASFMGKGIVLQKYTGSRGKAGASDANPEYLAALRKLFNDNGIAWQTGELGKVDQGGGGTIAQYLANLGMEVVDCGVPILAMHSPYEVTSKIDIYHNYKANRVFYGWGD